MYFAQIIVNGVNSNKENPVQDYIEKNIRTFFENSTIKYYKPYYKNLYVQ